MTQYSNQILLQVFASCPFAPRSSLNAGFTNIKTIIFSLLKDCSLGPLSEGLGDVRKDVWQNVRFFTPFPTCPPLSNLVTPLPPYTSSML